LREETGREFMGGVVCHTFTTFAVMGAGIGARAFVFLFAVAVHFFILFS
jgi:hypothetical protein